MALKNQRGLASSGAVVLLALACGVAGSGAHSVRRHSPAPIGGASVLPRPLLRLRGGAQTDIDIGHLGLDGLDDDTVLLAGDEDEGGVPPGVTDGLLDLTDDGGALALSPPPHARGPSNQAPSLALSCAILCPHFRLLTGVLKALLVPGWKSPLLGIGDEISISVVSRALCLQHALALRASVRVAGLPCPRAPLSLARKPVRLRQF